MKQVIEVINRVTFQIAMVIDDKQLLIGTLIDGDIWRALLCGMQIETAVEFMMCRSFRSLPATE
jgi:hypoxanthine-guanine phosphoribosyltransferase